MTKQPSNPSEISGKINRFIVKELNKGGAILQQVETKDEVFIPANFLKGYEKPGSPVIAFVYADAKGNLLATLDKPLAQKNELGFLKAIDETKSGIFFDLGINKDLYLPKKEAVYRIKIGESYLLKITVDKMGRLKGSTRIHDMLQPDFSLKIDNWYNCFIYRVNKSEGAYCAVSEKYKGLIPKNEYFTSLHEGEMIKARLIKRTEKGKLVLSPREPAYRQMDKDAEYLVRLIEKNGGFLPFNDKSEHYEIKEKLNLSKKSFKRAVGRLLKHGHIIQTDEGIKLKKN